MAEPRVLKFDDGYRSIEFTDMGERGIMIEIDAPWVGSTESGFGQTLSVTLLRLDAEKFMLWLEGQDEEARSSDPETQKAAARFLGGGAGWMRGEERVSIWPASDPR